MISQHLKPEGSITGPETIINVTEGLGCSKASRNMNHSLAGCETLSPRILNALFLCVHEINLKKKNFAIVVADSQVPKFGAEIKAGELRWPEKEEMQ